MSNWYAGNNSTNNGSFGWIFTTGATEIQPALFTNTQTFYGPTVTQTGGTQTLTPSLYTNTQTFYSPTVSTAVTLAPDLYSNAQTFYAPTVSATVALTPALYTNAQAFYSPTVSATYALAPALYTNAQTFYAPAVTTTVTIDPSLYNNSQTFFSAIVTQAGGPQYVLPDLYTNSQTFFDPTVTVTQANQSRSQGWILQQQRKRKWSEDKDEREQLRKAIELAIDPVTEKEAKVVTVKGEVAVVTESKTIALPMPPQFDAQAVARMAVSVLEAQGIEAKRVKDAQNRRMAEMAFQALRAEMERKRIKRRREEEILLLM